MTDRNTGEETPVDDQVDLLTTSCNRAGVRRRFFCPLSGNGVYCGRRVGAPGTGLRILMRWSEPTPEERRSLWTGMKDSPIPERLMDRWGQACAFVRRPRKSRSQPFLR